MKILRFKFTLEFSSIGLGPGLDNKFLLLKRPTADPYSGMPQWQRLLGVGPQQSSHHKTKTSPQTDRRTDREKRDRKRPFRGTNEMVTEEDTQTAF